MSVPLPDLGHRWGDVVLHDVVPAGTRTLAGQEVSVFDELIRMDPSPHPTHEASITAPAHEDAEALERLLDEHDLGGEDRTGSIEFLCAHCSRSSPHAHRDGQVDEAVWVMERRFGAAGTTDALASALSRAAAGAGRRSST